MLLNNDDDDNVLVAVAGSVGSSGDNKAWVKSNFNSVFAFIHSVNNMHIRALYRVQLSHINVSYSGVHFPDCRLTTVGEIFYSPLYILRSNWESRAAGLRSNVRKSVPFT